jgi:hypothetical protein
VTVCTRGGDRQCIRHMGRRVVAQWLDVFAHPDLEHLRFSVSLWNLHVQLHMFQYIRHLGPLYLLATDLGESHHSVQKRFGAMTNHQHGSMEVQILKKNHIGIAWRFHNGRHEPPAAPTTISANSERSLHSPQPSPAQITGTLIDVLHNVVTNTWASNIDRSELPLEGAVFSKMRLHGHFVSCGDDVAINGEGSDLPWFAKVVRFIRFDNVSPL